MQTVYRYNFSIDRKVQTKERQFTLNAKVCVFSGPVAWYYLILPKQAGQTIKKRFGHSAKGWGSLPVDIRAGAFEWQTSIFPDKKSGSYILPLKLEARKATQVKKGDTLNFRLTIR